jgi:hypothetical protein
MLPAQIRNRQTVGQLARAQTFRFVTMIATWALIFAAFIYHPEWIRGALRFMTHSIETIADQVPEPWGARLEIMLRELGGIIWLQIAVAIVVLRLIIWIPSLAVEQRSQAPPLTGVALVMGSCWILLTNFIKRRIRRVTCSGYRSRFKNTVCPPRPWRLGSSGTVAGVDGNLPARRDRIAASTTASSSTQVNEIVIFYPNKPPFCLRRLARNVELRHVICLEIQHGR